ncbi:MAG: hypothetical protein GXP11_10460 [Gammaproteobacteria bacterium]|nr:hypothetical protein [Gammaproteobacteria bacterium]
MSPLVSINHDVNILVVLVLVVLVAHYVSVPVLFLKPFRRFTPNVVTLLTWGGLCGGVSVAGIFDVKPRSFFAIDTLAGAAWVLLYMGLGRIVTRAWLNESIYVIGFISLAIITVVVVR